MRPSLARALVCLMAFPGVAQAVELYVDSETTIGYDTNVRNAATSAGPTSEEQQEREEARIESDAVFVQGFNFQLRGKDEIPSLRSWTLGYNPSYEYFPHVKDRRNFRHRFLVSASARKPRYGWNLRFIPTIRDFEETEQAPLRDSISWLGNGGFSFTLDPRTILSGTARFQRTTRDERSTSSTATPSDADVDAETRGDIDDGSLTLSLSRGLSNRWSFGSSLSYFFRDFEDPRRADFNRAAAEASMSYGVNSRSSVLGGVSLTRSESKPLEAFDQPGQTTFFLNLFAGGTYEITPRWSLSLRAGPTFFRNDDVDESFDDAPLIPFVTLDSGETAPFFFFTCPALSDGTVVLSTACQAQPPNPNFDLSDPANNPLFPRVVRNPGDLNPEPDGLTYFGNLQLGYSGERLSWSVRVSRSAGDAFGDIDTVVTDSAETVLTWRAGRRLKFRLRGNVTRRESTSESSVVFDALAPVGQLAIRAPSSVDPPARELVALVQDQATDRTNYALRGTATYEFNERVTGLLRLSYRNQRNRGIRVGNPFGSDLDDFRVELAFRYAFRPIPL